MKRGRTEPEEIGAGDPDFMQSLARGLAVIRAFGHRRTELGVAEIAAATGFSKSATRRCLHTLVRLGYAESDGARYALKAKILTLGYSYMASTSLTQILAPVVESMMQRIQESCSAGVLDDGAVTYIARSSPKRLVSVGLAVGSRSSPYYSSMGRIFLAAMAPDELGRFLTRVPLKPPTQHSIRSVAGLTRAVEKVRRDGFAVVDQELEIGARAIAVPVLDKTGRTVAAMNVGVPDARVPFEELERRYLRILKEAAEEVRRTLETL